LKNTIGGIRVANNLANGFGAARERHTDYA